MSPHPRRGKFKNQGFFAHLDKATIKLSCCEVSHQKFLGDMDQTDRCAQKVGFPRSGHIFHCVIQYHQSLFYVSV